MNTRTLLAGCLLLVPGCGPGPGDSSASAASTDTTAGTSGGTTTTSATSGTSGGSGSSAGTDATTDVPTTGDATSTGDSSGTTTTTTTGDTTGATTGPLICEMIVGSMDCAQLVEVSPDLSMIECELCQGAPCGQEPQCDGQYPCVDGSIVLRGCCTDEECEGLAPFCGMYIATNNVCVLSDDI